MVAGKGGLIYKQAIDTRTQVSAHALARAQARKVYTDDGGIGGAVV